MGISIGDNGGMQVHQIEYFLAVADTLSFTRGAARANVVQSAVSAGVRQLERELGAGLFERRAREVRLTAAGEALVPQAREVLAALRGAREAVDAVRGTVRGAVVLGTLAYLGSVDLAGILGTLQADYPEVVVKLRQTLLGTRTSLEQVRSGALDLALVSAGPGSLAGIERHELHAEPLVFTCPAGHRLAGRADVDPGEAAAEPFIDFPEGWGNRASVDRAFAAAGASRSIRTEVVDFGLALDLVRAGLGVAMLPASAVGAAPGLGTVGVTGLDVDWRIQLAWSTERALPVASQVLVRAFTATGPSS
jgi:DNA-binding transcriptional LysR family regulator